MALTFDWAESSGTQVQVEPKVIAVRMGDGYAQRSPDGLNNMPDNWDMRFTEVYPAAGDEIVAFFTGGGPHARELQFENPTFLGFDTLLAATEYADAQALPGADFGERVRGAIRFTRLVQIGDVYVSPNADVHMIAALTAAPRLPK